MLCFGASGKYAFFCVSLLSTRRRFNGQGSGCCMRVNISTNDAGIILAAFNAHPPIGGTAVSRVH